MEPDEYAKLLTVKLAEAEKAINDQMDGLLFMPPPGASLRIPSALWFSTHPMQRHTVIVTRETPNSPYNYESYAVEVWKDKNRIVAQCGDSKAGCIPGQLAWDNQTVFEARVSGLIDKVVDGFIANEQLQAWQEKEASKPPTPQGVGWDDFDWSI